MSTKTITISRLRNNIAEAFNSMKKEDVILVTRRGKTERAIVDVDKLEDLMAASDPEYLKSIKQARAQYKRGEIFSPEEVFKNL